MKSVLFWFITVLKDATCSNHQHITASFALRLGCLKQEKQNRGLSDISVILLPTKIFAQLTVKNYHKKNVF